MERGDRAPVATFHAPALRDARELVTLGEAQAHHARVKRLEVGDVVRLTDGAGMIAQGEIARIAKSALELRVDAPSRVELPRLAEVSLLVPVADRERMLWLAEKSAELALTRWQPVRFHRSRSVSPRGEGESFRARVLARMIQALEQSGGAWLPEVASELEPEEAADLFPDAHRLLLDAEGERPALPERAAAVAFALGPEGGLEAAERALFREHGWRPASLAPTVLRFETAGIAALAVARAALR